MFVDLPFAAPTPTPLGGGAVMNNGRQDTTLQDLQKLQQQLQDVKDQVGIMLKHEAST